MLPSMIWRYSKARLLLIGKFEWHNAWNETQSKLNRRSNCWLDNVNLSPWLTNFSHLHYESEKTDIIFDWIRLKGQQMALFECPRDWNPKILYVECSGHFDHFKSFSCLIKIWMTNFQVSFRSEWYFKSKRSLNN